MNDDIMIKDEGKWKLKKNPLGYWSIDPLPSNAELKNLFQERYYLEEKGGYTHKYTDDEVLHLENSAVVAEYILKKYRSPKLSESKEILDAGCGQGYFARHFHAGSAKVTTCDYAENGIREHNPQLMSTFIQGDLIEVINSLGEEGRIYDLVNLGQVLHCLRDPVQLLKDIRIISSPDSLLRITVPNDYSAFQQLLLDRKTVKSEWFFSPQQTLHYFNFASLKSLLEYSGYRVELQMASFPIDVFILNQFSNYVENPERGKQVHYTKVITDNFLLEQGIEEYIGYYEAAAKLGFGREIIMYASCNQNKTSA